MNSYPAHVYPSLVLSGGLTDLPSPLCPDPPISMVKSLQDVCVLKPYCCLKERPWRREGVCVFLLGRGSRVRHSAPCSPEAWGGCLGMGYFPWEACWGSWGCRCWGKRQCWNTALCLQSHIPGLQVQQDIGFPGLGGKSYNLGPLNPPTHSTRKLMWYPCDSQQHKLTRKWIFWTY